MVENQASSTKREDVDQLWFRLKEGEMEGLEGIYIYFAPSLFHYGLSLVHDSDFIQDCIQEIFLDLWKYRHNLQQADNVKMYLFKTLSYKIFREEKKNKMWKKEDVRFHLDKCFFTESHETIWINVQKDTNLQKKLAAALLILPLRQNQVIQHLFFENFTYEETSKIMGINVRSVYTLAWKAISHLKKIMLFYMFVGIW